MVKTNIQYSHVPCLVSTSQLQRNSGKIISAVAQSTTPYFVVRNNKPEAVILGINEYNELKSTREQWELADSLEAISVYGDEKSKKKLKTLTTSVLELWKNRKKSANS